ncbi:MAG TPA: helix-turn-helix transcriptional regulator [Puia sp.]|nr:helix-turn-helix transcriptional regulator [Puia sp.]
MDRQGDALRLLGRRITQLREQQQMTLDTLAARTGLDPSQLTAIEAGHIDIPITTIFLLAKAFGITADQFLDFPT